MSKNDDDICRMILLCLLLFLMVKPISGLGLSRYSYRDEYKAACTSTLKIVLQPSGTTDCKGNKVTFSTGTEGGTGKIHYLWKRKRPTDSTFSEFGAADSVKLPVYNIGVGKEAPQGTLYQVIVSDQTGLLISESALLTVNEVTAIAPAGVAVYTVDEGTSLAFSVLTSGNAPLSYQWIKKFGTNDWRNLVDNQSILGSQEAQLRLTSLSVADSGIYKVRVSFPTANGNQCAETSSITRTIHVKQVADTIAPNFIGPVNKLMTLCPEDILQAAWDEPLAAIQPAPTSFCTLHKNNDLFDLPDSIFHDNVTPPSELILHWGIRSGKAPFDPVADVAGNLLDDRKGQISLHPEDIDLNGSEESCSTYMIVFWLEDLAGNLTEEAQRYRIEISISQRPLIVSKF